MFLSHLDFPLSYVIGVNWLRTLCIMLIKAAYSVTFDLLILEIKFLFFKNTVKILKFR